MALIVAIGFLLILSILGTVVLDVANRGLKQISTFTPVKRSFYAVDQAVEYSMNGDLIYNLSMSGTVNLLTGTARNRSGAEIADNVPGAGYLYDPAGGSITHRKIIESISGGKLVAGTVNDLGPHTLPAGLAGKYTTDFGANLYHVSAEAEVSTGGETQKVDASIVRLYKLEDDTIFRTTGGG